MKRIRGRHNGKLRKIFKKTKAIEKLSVCDLMGYTNEVGYIGETIHPFTSSGTIHDVRATTRYDEAFFSNLYSVMHEVGHALYEIQNDAQWNKS